MFALIETIIGFAAIMLVLSFLVKSMTSVVKNHIDYYSKNLKGEVDRFVRGTIGKTLEECSKKRPWLSQIQWQRLGEEFLSRENMEWLLTELGGDPNKLAKEKEKLSARLEVHKANLQYAFEKRTKNISLLIGLAFCLFLNINAVTIWDTLYRDQDVRAKFSSPEFVEEAQDLAAEYEEKIRDLEEAIPEAEEQNQEDLEKQREALEKQREAVLGQISHFRGEVTFGVGRIWTDQTATWLDFFYEFFGALLTGFLVSIGAPYWHDLLGLMVRARAGKGR